MTHPPHSVIFYDRDDSLIEQLAAFTVEGLTAGERVMVIATPQHIAGLVTALSQQRDVTPAQNNLVLLYATDAIRRVVPDGAFDRERLFEWLGPVVDRGPCRVYGEMASLLAERGQLDAAFDLEAAGDELAERKGVRVLCGYDMRHLAESPRAAHGIAARHHDVVPQPPRADGALTAGRRLRVLLAEDFEDAREMYAEYLQYADIEVVTAVDGEDAVRIAREWTPDLILMDIRMPRLTGTEAMRILREDDRFRNVPFVALTAHALDSERAAILADGFDGVITKPCLPDRLVAEVRARLVNLARGPA
jgi:CheY-like chemotaxis protein